MNKKILSQKFVWSMIVALVVFVIINIFESGLEKKVRNTCIHSFVGGSAHAEENDDLYKQAMFIAKKGNEFFVQHKYGEAIPALEQAKELWEQLPQEKRGINYATTLAGLGGSYIHFVVETYFNKGYKLPDALNKLERGRNLALRAIDEYNNYASVNSADETKSKRAITFSSGAYNVLGVATKYLGDPEKAKVYYNEAIRRRSNQDAENNLKGVYNNKDVFLK